VPHQLVLASASPRRQQFLRELGLEFTVVVADIDESPHVNEAPACLAARLAETKARAVAGRLPAGEETQLVIAADTVVALGATILGKPANDVEAASMLAQLRGRMHEVHTAVSVVDTQSGTQSTRVNTTQVAMRPYSNTELAAYVATGDPLDKAGAYAIQHPEFAPVAALTGCAAGVIGLPLGDLCDLLRPYGVAPALAVAAVCQRHTAFRCCRLVAS
jgi:septum formation protein